MNTFANQTQACHLTCESLNNPMGLDQTLPRLSWQSSDSRQHAKQIAYQIHVASDSALIGSDADLWDSGKVESDQSIFVKYAGKELTSRQRCCWAVRIWDQEGEVSQWSDIATFEIGLLNRKDWQARWIGGQKVGDEKTYLPAPMLRKTFSLENKPVSARLYVTALGLYDCKINGNPVTADVLRPGWTDYNHRLIYQVYDVTEQLDQGDNVIGCMLGDGWYNGRVAWKGRQNYGKQPQFLAQLEVTDANGKTTIITTDDSWKNIDGPIRSNDLLMGEDYDANHEQPGWALADFDDSSWQSIKNFGWPNLKMVGVRNQAVRKIQELTVEEQPVEIEKGRWIFNIKQNMVGWIRLQLKGKAGQTVTMRYAEFLNPKGTIYNENYRSAKATDTYTFAKDGVCTYEPTFTFHGFQYVELSGLDEVPPKEAITGIVIHSDTPATGTFECSNAMVNQLQSNITWGQRGNFFEVPTDCPQRDERLGWTGDAQVFIRTAAFNMDVSAFYNKWFDDMQDSQTKQGTIPAVIPAIGLNPEAMEDGGPAWADAAAICPWTLYQCYGDIELIRERYVMLKNFVDALHANSHDFIRCDRRFSKEHCYKDWLNHDAVTDADLIGTAFLAYSTNLFAKMLIVIDKHDEAAYYKDLFEKTCTAFCQQFVTPAGRMMNHTQTAYLLALHFDLLPESQRQTAADWLASLIRERDVHLSTGFVGSPYLNHVLCRFGYLDLAYELLLQETYPSWLYPVTQGATTIWERWDSYHHERGFQTTNMNSFNHYAYGAIGSWLYQTVAGIEIDEANPGYKQILIAPKPGGELTYAKATLQSAYGLISSAWEIDETGVFTLDVIIPANTTATVTLPNGEVHEMGSGQYQWQVGVLATAIS